MTDGIFQKLARRLVICAGIVSASGASYGDSATTKNAPVPSKVTAQESPLITPIGKPLNGLFPLVVHDDRVKFFSHLLFEGLTSTNPETGLVEPSLAKSWVLNPDRKEITFNIDPKARFWDGSKVTAADVRFSLEIFETPGVDTEPWATHYLFIDEVKEVNPQTVTVSLQDWSYEKFLQVGIIPIYSKAYYAPILIKDPKIKDPKSRWQPMGTGPFRFVGQAEGLWKFERFQAYWNKAAHLKEGRWTHKVRHLRYTPKRDQILAGLTKGSLSFSLLSQSEWSDLQKNPAAAKGLKFVRTTERLPRSYDAIVWNLRRGGVTSIHLRWALAMITDIEKWCRDFDGGATMPAISPYFPNMDPQVQLISYNPKAAKKRKEMSNFDFVRSLKILYPEGQGQYKEKLADLQKAAAKIGIAIEPEAMSWQGIQHAIANHNFDGVVMSWSRNFDGTLRSQFEASAVKEEQNYGFYKSAQFDTNVFKFGFAKSAKERRGFRNQLSEKIYADQPYLMLSQPRYTYYAVDKKIKRPKDSFKHSLGLAYWGF